MTEKGLKHMGNRLNLFTILAFNLYLGIEYFLYPQYAKTIVALFWIQSILLAIENVILMLVSKTGEQVETNHEQRKSTRSMNVFMALFFMVHHGIFILVMGLMGVMNRHIPGTTENLPWVKLSVILLIVLMLLDLPRKIYTVSRRSPGIFTMMFVPYVRLIPFAMLILTADVWPVALIMGVFLLMKMAVDLLYYFYMKI